MNTQEIKTITRDRFEEIIERCLAIAGLSRDEGDGARIWKFARDNNVVAYGVGSLCEYGQDGSCADCPIKGALGEIRYQQRAERSPEAMFIMAWDAIVRVDQGHPSLSGGQGVLHVVCDA